ncbi:MAG: HDIG domain-containing protein [Candidatus Ancaeobacter aquaticus]|nr:HDIG domain-containing protein [Candidatus Ancaeobacter aquaticus]
MVKNKNGKKTEIRTRSKSYSRHTFLQSGNAVKIMLAVLTIVAVYMIFIQKSVSPVINLSLGQMSPTDIYATTDFRFTDEDMTEALRLKASENVIPVYSINDEEIKVANEKIKKFFSDIAPIAANIDLSFDDKLEQAKSISGINISDEDLAVLLITDDITSISDKCVSLYGSLMKQGILSKTDKVKMYQDVGDRINILDSETGHLRLTPVSSVISMEDIDNYLLWQAKKQFSNSRFIRSIVNYLGNYVDVNLVFDKGKTEELQESAKDNVKKQYDYVKKGQIIIRKGEEIKKRHIAELKALAETEMLAESKKGKWLYRIGIVLITILLVIFFTEYMRVYEGRLFQDNAKLFLIVIIFLATLVVSKFVLYINEQIELPLLKYIIVVPCASILFALLINQRVSLILTVVLSVFLALMNAQRLDFALLSLAGGVAAIFISRTTKHRWQVMRIGLVVALTNVMLICAFQLIGNFSLHVFINQAISGVIAGLVCAILAAFFIPLLEYIFNIPTDLKLLEYLDLNHPLLKEMVLKAPGTYHHCLMVGNLAEAASAAIGANPLLAKVGAYFHDIGKLLKPEYYSENEAYGKSFHQGLNPSMSSLIILSHVKDGADLARKYKLPKVITDILQEHHGTSLVYYFYKKAESIATEGDIVEEESYRYKGPKPHSKESGIVLFADAIEAASRSIDKPTPSRLENLIKEIINNKINDEQLDECDLTLKEINTIAETFLRVLVAIYHSRIKYPKEENSEKHDDKKSDKEIDFKIIQSEC